MHPTRPGRWTTFSPSCRSSACKNCISRAGWSSTASGSTRTRARFRIPSTRSASGPLARNERGAARLPPRPLRIQPRSRLRRSRLAKATRYRGAFAPGASAGARAVLSWAVAHVGRYSYDLGAPTDRGGTIEQMQTSEPASTTCDCSMYVRWAIAQAGSGTARSSSVRRAATAPASARSTGMSPRPAGSAGASPLAEQSTRSHTTGASLLSPAPRADACRARRRPGNRGGRAGFLAESVPRRRC
jgi:hypothetical protein